MTSNDSLSDEWIALCLKMEAVFALDFERYHRLNRPAGVAAPRAQEEAAIPAAAPAAVPATPCAGASPCNAPIP